MQRRLYSLDYLKIGSAFVILYFHSLGWQQTSFKSAYIDSLVSNGAVVMVLFFMLSGFCLFYNYGEKDYTTLANVTAFLKKELQEFIPRISFISLRWLL